jgi:hypothetical protein
MGDDIELQQQILQDAQQGREWVLQTSKGSVRFEMTAVDRTLRARAQSALPETFFDEMLDALEGEDIDDLSLDDLDTDEINMQSFVLPPEAVDALEDVLVAALNHEQYADLEIREIVEVLPDALFYEAAFEALSMGADREGIESFREV